MAATATVYRMATPDHICPFGLKSLYLLKRKGLEVDDIRLTSRQDTERFMREHGVDTTPQTFIDSQRIGGYEALRRYFGLSVRDKKGTSYRPVVMIFGSALLMAAAVLAAGDALAPLPLLETFVAMAMALLAVQKLRDIDSFSNQFITYDLLSMRLPPYAYAYPYLELYVGVGMLANLPALLYAPVGIVIGSLGAVSVIKAVYIDKRELRCACVGGDSQVPLGFVSLSENLAMLLAGIWMLVK